MPGELGAGLYLKSGGTVWHVRRRVPEDLRAQFGHEFKASLKTADIDLARARRDAWWAERDRDIELARASGAKAVASVADVLQAIERWREAACLDAARMRKAEVPREPTFIKLENGSFSQRRDWSPLERFLFMQDHPWEMVNAVASAEAYFADHPGMSFEPSLPLDTAWRLERLEAVARGEGDWRHVEDFDAKLDLALSLAKLTAFLLPQVRHAVRPRFAAAWAEVVRHEELQRRRAALVLAANDAVWARPSDVRAPPTSTGYVPRYGDKTLRDVIDLARAEKARGKSPEAGEAFVRKNYEHVFRALEELIGESTPIRALQRVDVRELRTLFERLPPNVTKIYRGMPLIEVAERAEAEGREPMAPNTARSYMVNLSALCNLAVAEGWLEKNPCDGLIPGRRDSVRRRGFTGEELTRIFASLEGERYSDRWWVLVILAYSGARASEVCQLQTGDVKFEQGLPFFDFSVFDAAGVRSDVKRVKTESSDRAAPLHPELVRAGLLDLVEGRRDAGEARLFPSIRRHPLGGYSYDLSKWFGKHLDGLGLSEPALVMHSFRHGFRQAGRRVNLDGDIIDALGGWAPKSVGAKYGDREAIPDNTVHIAKIEFGGFVI
jgi:integrase